MGVSRRLCWGCTLRINGTSSVANAKHAMITVKASA